MYPRLDSSSIFVLQLLFNCRTTSLPGGHCKWVPPDPIPNSEVKLLSADDSVGPPHVKVGHCQALIQKPPSAFWRLGVFLYGLAVSY